MRTCINCKISKQLNCFYPTKYRKDGLYAWCKQCTDKRNKKYRENNLDKFREYTRKYRERNPNKGKEYYEKVKAENPDKLRSKWNKDFSIRLLTTAGRLNNSMRSNIHHSLCGNKNGRHWEDLVGYTLDNLKQHLEKQFVNNMTWENYGEWHIDHIVPISAHNFTNPEHEDFKRCWALSNLQPLWAKENISKFNKLDKPFQPWLLLEA